MIQSPTSNTIINDITHLPMREWVLLRSEALGGDFTVRTCKEFYFNPTSGIAYGDITYSAGLAKIYDELITNATDNYNRNRYLYDPIEVDISDKHIRVKNYGATIPLVKEYDKDLQREFYKPEMAFSVFHSSSNYDDSITRTSNGKNGVGVKLANVFATYFEINIVHNGYKYHQTFQNNMDPKMTSQPLITQVQNERDSVEVICYPDFPKLHISGITEGNLYHLLFRTFECVAFGRDI
jgi:DNA topoisomerase-2